jgi:hypothetical protein
MSLRKLYEIRTPVMTRNVSAAREEFSSGMEDN